MKTMRRAIKSVPLVGALLIKAKRLIASQSWQGSAAYWQKRYATGGNSGDGSYGELALFKSEILNRFVEDNDISDVIEYGCGDGNQLGLSKYPQYIGFDVSKHAISICREKFNSDSRKSFKLISEYSGELADLTISLDVLFHLVEYDVYESYMSRLFDSAKRFVIIYSSDFNAPSTAPHMVYRKFTDWIRLNRSDWTLILNIPNRYPRDPNTNKGSLSDFYIFQRA